MADMDDPDKLPFGWSPLVLDAGKPGSTLADWAQLAVGRRRSGRACRAFTRRPNTA